MNSVERGSDNLISYSRDYRRLRRPGLSALGFLLFPVLPVTLGFVLLHQPITLLLSRWAAAVLSPVLGAPAEVVESPWLPWFGGLNHLALPGAEPTLPFALANALASVAVAALVGLWPDAWRPLAIYVRMCSAIHLASSGFFILAPGAFPYTLTGFSELLMRLTVSAWAMVALLSGVALGMLADGGLARHVAFLATVAASLLLGCLRYVVFLLVLEAGSSIYMAVLFFGFGALFDLLQMVGVYSLFVAHVSRRLARPEWRGRWQWS